MTAQKRHRVVVMGNPNVGKSTLFNALTGGRAKVGNYPGITVERRSGELRLDEVGTVELVDVPGTYSLCARSLEEQIAINSALGLFESKEPDLAIVVLDAGQLIRNLYLAVQLAEMRVPLVLVLNMIDENDESTIDQQALSELFAAPVVATSARDRVGLEELKRALGEALAGSPGQSRVQVRYPPELTKLIDRAADALPEEWKNNVERSRALALWALMSVGPDDELDLSVNLKDTCIKLQNEAPDVDIDGSAIKARYEFLDAQAANLLGNAPGPSSAQSLSQKLDRVLLNPAAGLLLFLGIMFIVFQALFSWSDPAISAVEAVFARLATTASQLMPEGHAQSFVVDGLISGVGNVLVFLPQILLLFLFIGILEASGYMARVAYLMDRLMRSLGLHGRAFVPMLSGFACAVPAILATRTMERERDRLLTMLVIPLMTCSARLPVYTLIIAALFPPKKLWGFLPQQGFLMVAMYAFSMVITLLAAGVLGRTVVRGKSVPLILELPPYRLPKPGAILSMMWERSALFVREAGGVILVCTVVLWALLSFPASPNEHLKAPAPEATIAATNPPGTAKQPRAAENEQLKQSYAGRLGQAMEPALTPLGFDWRLGVGIIGAFAAREVFVSTLGLVYGLEGTDADDTPLRKQIQDAKRPDGKPRYTPLVGLSLMVFFALACQCISTLAVVRRETKTWRWPAFLFVYMTALAYLSSLLIYQGGKALGFS